MTKQKECSLGPKVEDLLPHKRKKADRVDLPQPHSSILLFQAGASESDPEEPRRYPNQPVTDLTRQPLARLEDKRHANAEANIVSWPPSGICSAAHVLAGFQCKLRGPSDDPRRRIGSREV